MKKRFSDLTVEEKKEYWRESSKRRYHQKRKALGLITMKEINERAAMYDDLIRNTVAANPLNLTHAFSLVARASGRDIRAISYRWYSVLRTENNVKVTCGSVAGFSINRKNLPRDRNGNLPVYEAIHAPKLIDTLNRIIKL